MARSENNKSITIAASNAGAIVKRFSTVETEAARIHAEREGAALARVIAGPGGIHLLMTDRHGTTLEIAEGRIAATVREQEPSE